jgi:DNA (cytosine-5)-methyltransferase 1
MNKENLNELALFAGAGGGILGGHLLGWRTVCAVEWEQHPASVLCARQNEGILPPFPIWDDVQTFDGKPWREIVDVVSGGFPCQDISVAGKGDGLDGERSGMWREMARIIHEVQPRFVFVENSPMLTSRGLGRVLGDLATMGFNARWGVLGAADVGANHQRNRIWIVGKMANPNNNGHYHKKSRELLESPEQTKTREESNKTSRHNLLADTTQLFSNGINDNTRISLEREKESKLRNSSWAQKMAYTGKKRLQRYWNEGVNDQSQGQQTISRGGVTDWSGDWWETEPIVGRVADGVADRVDRLKAIGNGQVPLCAATAWRILSESL